MSFFEDDRDFNSAEHELYPTYKSQITEKCIFFLLNIAEHEYFSAIKYEIANLAFSYLLTKNISCSAELSMRKNL